MKNVSTKIIATLFFATTMSCSGNAQKEQNGNQNPESSSPNTSIKPAFSGQTRIAGIETKTPYKVEVIAENLGKPWEL